MERFPAVAILLALFVPAVNALAEGGKAPVPAAGAQLKAAQLVEEVNGREYELDIRVTLKGTDAELITRDQRPFMHWKGPQSDLAVPPEWSLLKPNAFGVGGDNQLAISNARLRMISGRLSPLGKAAYE